LDVNLFCSTTALISRRGSRVGADAAFEIVTPPFSGHAASIDHSIVVLQAVKHGRDRNKVTHPIRWGPVSWEGSIFDTSCFCQCFNHVCRGVLRTGLLSAEHSLPLHRQGSSLERGIVGAPPPLVRDSDHRFTAAEVERLLAVRETEVLIRW